MSNSKLVTYTKLSPNCNKPRNHAIDTITIHCFVGQVTAKEGCNAKKFVKYNPITGGSCNYVVGHDGSIGLCVEEANRSWCTSNRANDHRAITIEVASETKHPYKVTDKAYKALVELCADICKRNNIKKLLWKGDKKLKGKVDQQNMTVHRWFAAKACPGEYLYNLHGDIAKRVNTLLGVEAEDEIHVTYKVYTNKWLPEVVDCNDNRADGYAGINCENMTALMAKPDKGTLKYRVHLVGGKGNKSRWLPWVENDRDYAGNKGQKIDAVQMQLLGVEGYEVKYRVSPASGTKWYGWCTGLTDATGDGYAGVFGKPIDCIQMKIVKKGV